MLQVINGVLDADTLKKVQSEIASGQFDDGRNTAFGMARKVKKICS